VAVWKSIHYEFCPVSSKRTDMAGHFGVWLSVEVYFQATATSLKKESKIQVETLSVFMPTLFGNTLYIVQFSMGVTLRPSLPTPCI
jgi:hypothetical protein